MLAARSFFKYKDGREISLGLDSNFKPMYKDEYTNEVLPYEAAKDAMLDELKYFCDVVFRGVHISDALNDPEGKLVGCRWVNCNKGDLSEPDVPCRLVAQEVNHGDGPMDAFYAATPPWRPRDCSLANGRRNVSDTESTSS